MVPGCGAAAVSKESSYWATNQDRPTGNDHVALQSREIRIEPGTHAANSEQRTYHKEKRLVGNRDKCCIQVYHPSWHTTSSTKSHV